MHSNGTHIDARQTTQLYKSQHHLNTHTHTHLTVQRSISHTHTRQSTHHTQTDRHTHTHTQNTSCAHSPCVTFFRSSSLIQSPLSVRIFRLRLPAMSVPLVSCCIAI